MKCVFCAPWAACRRRTDPGILALLLIIIVPSHPTGTVAALLPLFLWIADSNLQRVKTFTTGKTDPSVSLSLSLSLSVYLSLSHLSVRKVNTPTVQAIKNQSWEATSHKFATVRWWTSLTVNTHTHTHTRSS